MRVWVFPGFVIAVILLWIVSRIRAYRRFFADAHFMEISQGVPRLKAAALDRIIAPNEDQAPSPSDPRALVTSAWRSENIFGGSRWKRIRPDSRSELSQCTIWDIDETKH